LFVIRGARRVPARPDRRNADRGQRRNDVSRYVSDATAVPVIILDGQVLVPPLPRTWAAVLSSIDEQLAAQHRIVTDVAFDGIDEPAFRDPPALGRSLDGVATVEVQSGTAAGLMERCVAEAIAATDVLAAAAAQIGADVRAGSISRGRLGLAELAEGLASLLAITEAAGLALRVDLEHASCGDRPVASLVEEMTGYVDAMVAAHQAADWAALADVLQHDLEPALRRWKPVLGVFTAAA
jgi:hypothetical protein